jgi:hypothetical protein
MYAPTATTISTKATTPSFRPNATNPSNWLWNRNPKHEKNHSAMRDQEFGNCAHIILRCFKGATDSGGNFSSGFLAG